MPPQSYKEKDFEAHIESQLLTAGYVSNQPDDYDRELCLLTADVVAFVQATQPKEWEKLAAQYDTETESKFLHRLGRELTKRGALDVLRKGIKDRGAKFNLAYFKPASGMNPEHEKLYRGNQFAVVRQLKYSTKNENELDLTLFFNGIPIITVELKNSLTGQTVDNAIKQYKYDRNPKGEPLLAFQRCLVHFAVGNEKAAMTTKLAGKSTFFLPFNKDIENPINPDGNKTAYLWQDIWQPDTLLTLIDSYLHLQTSEEKIYSEKTGQLETKTKSAFIFPRYHQLDAVRQLLAAAKQEGAGHNYLIQHSAGSGKSNSIAWLAHQLANLYQNPADTERLFDSIIVVTDRRLLDKQLQDTIKQFEQTSGVVKPIDGTSADLKEAIEGGKDIIITTLQKFPVISASVSAMPGKKFAVLIDEAHSSQSGESSKHLKQALSAGLEDAESEDADDFDLEDEVVREIRSRGRQSHISYFAFTATPKNKTLELFGRKNEGSGNFLPFHTYTMHQAIHENFILNVLENYTSFQRYFKLVKSATSDEEYQRNKAVRLLMRWVDLQEHAIEEKARIMLEHFLNKSVHEIQGKARAMVVTRSRLHAVKFFKVLRRLMVEEYNLAYKPLVAFSGTVNDGGLEHTENNLNQLPPKTSIPDAFKTPDYRMLVVANKFQTGYDEPLLHTMYVDKKLAGVQAVQTLSRLNRTTKGKSGTFVLDFVNEAEKVQMAFQEYYSQVQLAEETEPNKLYDLQDELLGYEVFTNQDVQDFAKVFFNTAIQPEKMQPILDNVVHIWRNKTEDEREGFRSTLQQYIRFYGFVSQVITFSDGDLEKLYAFARHLNRKLDKRTGGSLPYEIQDAIDLDSFRIQKIFEGGLILENEDATLEPISEGAGGYDAQEDKDPLSIIIKDLNDLHGVNITEDDVVDMAKMRGKIFDDEELKAVMQGNNTTAAQQDKFDKVVNEKILEFVYTKMDLYKKLSDDRVNAYIKRKWFEEFAGMSGD